MTHLNFCIICLVTSMSIPSTMDYVNFLILCSSTSLIEITLNVKVYLNYPNVFLPLTLKLIQEFLKINIIIILL